MYDSLNALRKIRNDAAHSTNKFELQQLSEKLKPVYNLGPGIQTFIKDISTRSIVTNKFKRVEMGLAESDLNNEEKQKMLEGIFQDEKNIRLLEQQIPFWELLYGLTLLCGLLVDKRNKIDKLMCEINTLGDLLKKN